MTKIEIGPGICMLCDRDAVVNKDGYCIDCFPGAYDFRANLEREYGKTWTTKEAVADFEFISFLAPQAIVKERATGARGTLTFTHMPRFYFSWQPD